VAVDNSKSGVCVLDLSGESGPAERERRFSPLFLGRGSARVNVEAAHNAILQSYPAPKSPREQLVADHYQIVVIRRNEPDSLLLPLTFIAASLLSRQRRQMLPFKRPKQFS